MKKTLQLSIILAVFFFALSCEKTSYEYFLIAERMVDNQPENSIILLKSLDRTAFSDEYNARWAIAVTNAQDKINRRHTDDSLIKTAVQYYERHYNPKALAKAYYFMGRVSQELQNAPLAQEYYLKAIDVGETAKDTFQLALTCNQLGQLYTSQYAYRDAITYLKKSLHHILLLNDTVAQSYILRNIARNYGLMDSLDTSIDYYREALQYANHIAKPSILSELGERLTVRHDYDSAYVSLREAVNTADEEDLPLASLHIGRYFVTINQPDSAIRYLNSCINAPKLETRLGAYKYLAQLSRHSYRYENYIKYQTQYELLRDTFETRLHTQTTIELQALYDHQKIQKIATKAREASNRAWLNFWIALAVLFFVTSCATAYIIRIHRKRMREAKAREEVFLNFHNIEMQRSLEQVEKNIAMIAQLQIEKQKNKKRRDLIASKIHLFELANLWILKTLEDQEKAAKQYFNSEIYLRLHNDRQINTITMDELEGFFELTDMQYPRFKLGITNLLKITSKEDIFICYLLKARVRKVNIGKILKLSRQAINNRCKRLSLDIFQADCAPGLLEQLISSM
ncbi:MAG: hypothetical protein LBD28_06125 [Tannerellaceae bacterium]|nr:hypothetical protein [Tannerellaceae bacterium]